MSKWYEVIVKSCKTYMVEIEDDSNESPVTIVTDELFSDEWDEAFSCEIEEEFVENFMKHTDKDKIFSLEGE